MDLVLSEEQRLVQGAAHDFVASRSSLKRVRKATASDATERFSREIWKEMAGLGWLGLLFPEAHGGSALGQRYLMLVLEEVGRGLMPEPVLPTVMLGGGTLALGGSAAQRGEHLEAIAAGERLFALAYQERWSRYDTLAIETSADPSDGGFVLRGEKTHVLGASSADWLIVSGKTSARGLTLFVLPKSTAGVTVARQSLLDGRDVGLVKLDGARVGKDSVVGTVDEGHRLLARVIDRASVGLAAEMLGGMNAAFDLTLAYLKTRSQFGVLIGTFQALQHRAAKLFVETELARSSVMSASGTIDDAPNEREVARAASIAKAKCADAFMLVAHEAVQMHGGIGMTEEHDIGLYLKRARVAEMTFGDSAYHRERFARLEGF